jgi:xanthine dehydrogenase FAD-binding subunit
LQAVKYARASSIDEAVKMLQEGGSGTRVLAGGTDVIILARERRIDVDTFVDVKDVPETTALSYNENDGLTVGAALALYNVYNDRNVRQHYPSLVDSTTVIGGTAIQGRATLGGNLCNSSPAADSIPTMIALDATASIVGPDGQRDVAVVDFCTGPGQNVLQNGEFVVSINFPAQPENSGAAWQRFIPRNEMDIAVASAASALQFDGSGSVTSARIALGAVAATPLFVAAAGEALVGAPLSDDSIAAAAAASREAASPIDDMRGTIKHRTHLSGVLTERTIRDAAERAGVSLG